MLPQTGTYPLTLTLTWPHLKSNRIQSRYRLPYPLMLNKGERVPLSQVHSYFQSKLFTHSPLQLHQHICEPLVR